MTICANKLTFCNFGFDFCHTATVDKAANVRDFVIKMIKIHNIIRIEPSAIYARRCLFEVIEPFADIFLTLERLLDIYISIISIMLTYGGTTLFDITPRHINPRPSTTILYVKTEVAAMAVFSSWILYREFCENRSKVERFDEASCELRTA